MVNKRKISVRISEEDYQYLKTRRITMSQWIRSSIRYSQAVRKASLKWLRNRRRTDLDFKHRLSNQNMDFQVKKKISEVHQGIPLVLVNSKKFKSDSERKQFLDGHNLFLEYEKWTHNRDSGAQHYYGPHKIIKKGIDEIA